MKKNPLKTLKLVKNIWQTPCDIKSFIIVVIIPLHLCSWIQPLQIIADLCNEEDAKKVMEETIGHFNRLDILVR